MKKSELRQIIREEIQKLTEEIVASVNINGKEVGIFKNPKSIKRMEDYSRAISDDRGNLYIIDSPEWIHLHLMQWLKKVMKIDLGSDPYDVDNIIAWQKEKDGSLYLSPGYSKSAGYYNSKGKIDKVEEMMEIAQKKNPHIDFQLGISTEYSKHS